MAKTKANRLAAQKEAYRGQLEDLRRLLFFLLVRGPTPGADAAAELGWSLDRWSFALWMKGKARCWDVTGRGVVCTTAGRVWLHGLAPDHTRRKQWAGSRSYGDGGRE